MKKLKIGNVKNNNGIIKGYINRVTFENADNIYYELIINRKFKACFLSAEEMKKDLLKK